MKVSMSIIIGIISIITGVILAATTGKYLSGLLILAGIVLLFTLKESKRKLELFLKSFKTDKKLLLTAVIDLIYWAVFFVLLTGAKSFLEKRTRLLALNKAIGPSFAAVQQNLAIAKQIIMFVIGLILAVAILVLIFYSISRYFIWAILSEKKLSKKKLLKFFFLNLLWSLLWAPISIFLLVGVKQNLLVPALIVMVLFYMYMTTRLHQAMLKTSSIRKSFSEGICSLVMIPKYLQPISCITIVYFILAGIFWALGQATQLGVWFRAIVFILYVVWLRKYLKDYSEKFKV